jgi:cellulose synthase/poly-beta-1,6-N-acetylglucosamine synthase-like glycosyltransferase
MIACQIAVGLLALSYLMIFLFYLYGWISLPVLPDKRPSGEMRVSVIVPARNEAANIERILNDLLAQSYPVHLTEIWIIDDHSADATTELAARYTDPRVRLIRLQEVLKQDEVVGSYKKKAIEEGILRSGGELIVTTDADCSMQSGWLKTIVGYLESSGAQMVVAPVLIKNGSGLLGKFQALDLVGMMGITGATLHLGFPTMCNGANLAFRKAAFYEVGGYEGNTGTTSGDDLFLMHKMAAKWKRSVRFLKNGNAIVETLPQQTFRSFIAQRMRWASKSPHYDDWKIKANLLLVYLFNLSIVTSLVMALLRSEFWPILIFQISVKLTADFVFLSETSAFFHRRKLMWLFLPMEVFHILYIVVIGFAGNFFQVNWKGRKVK